MASGIVGSAEEEVRPAPAVGSAGERRDPTDDRGAEHCGRAGRARDARIDPATDRRSGYVSAISEPCTGKVFDFAMPTPKRAQNKVKALAASPQKNTIAEKTAVAAADDRAAAVPVGQPAHRERAEHEERAGRGADEHDDAVADAEGVADVGREHRERSRSPARRTTGAG